MTDARVPLRYSKKRHNQPWAYAGVVFFAGIGLAGTYATLGLALQLRNGPGMVAVTAVLALVFLAFGGWAAAGCLATTRPWWTLEVRGSIYVDHRSFGRRPKRYDLASATRAWVIPHHDIEYGYRLSLNLRLPDGPAKIQVADFTGLGAALADALAEHPDPAVVQKAIADLRWFARASRRDLVRWRAAQRAARRK